MKAIIDEDACTGCGLCVDTCSAVFEIQDAVAVVKVSEIPASEEESANQVALDCPVEAITIE